MTTTIDLTLVQAMVLRGFRIPEAQPHVYYGFLDLGDAASAKAVVSRLSPRVTSCADWDRGPLPFILGLGFTASGLELLGTATERFPIEFKLGMASRASMLGDTGESAPERWEPGFTAPDLHAVVMVTAQTPDGIAAGRRFLDDALAAAPAAKILLTEVGDVFPDNKTNEHFGFVDGIGQPFVEGSGLTQYPGEGTPGPNNTWIPIKAGEFVLGYENEAGHNAYPDPPFKNGSYFVYRKLEQRVLAFRQYTAAVAAQVGISPLKAAAQCMGRWQSGAPLALAPEVDDPALAADWERNNDFRYDDDPGGFRCPHGAHARRNNPRADPTGPTLQQVREHRLIRRSLPYGPWLPDDATRDDGVARGIHFTIVNADIANQFEYVQLNWINGTLSSTALSTEIDLDPIVGANDGTGKLVSPGVPQPAIAWDLPRFVEVRGGAYFFLPGMDTLAQLGAAPAS